MLSKKEFKNISLEDHAEFAGRPVSEIFCEYWITGRVALELIETTVKNPIVKLLCSILISVGDNLKKKFC